MKNLNKNQWIAVSVSLVFLAYILFAGPIMRMFNTSTEGSSAQFSQSSSGLKVEDLSVGNGDLVAPGDTLSVHYVGILSNGQIFDSSLERNAPFSFTLGVGSVIRGWDEGLVGMRVGGKRLLTISPEYAYGDQAIGAIPPNSTLTFTVELLDAEKPASR